MQKQTHFQRKLRLSIFMIGYAEQNGLMHSLLYCASYALEQTAFPFTKKCSRHVRLARCPQEWKKNCFHHPIR